MSQLQNNNGSGHSISPFLSKSSRNFNNDRIRRPWIKKHPLFITMFTLFCIQLVRTTGMGGVGVADAFHSNLLDLTSNHYYHYHRMSSISKFHCRQPYSLIPPQPTRKRSTHTFLLNSFHNHDESLLKDENAYENNQPQQQTSHNDGDGVALYIHIPYCRRRCRYCDFAIVPIGGNSIVTSSSLSLDDGLAKNQQEEGFLQMDQTYREAILKELSLIQKHYNKNQQGSATSSSSSSHNRKIPLRSIYFGGGTPSLAPLETIEAILNMILKGDTTKYHDNDDVTHDHTDVCGSIFDIGSDGDGNDRSTNNIEITMEIDPGTFTLSKLQSYKRLGINRLSLGIQSFDDTILESIGRVHRYQDILNSLQMIEQVYGSKDDNDQRNNSNNHDNAINYSIDLISGLPGLTLAKWIETLQIATSLVPQPSHISLYDLQIESGTVFGNWYDNTDGDDNSGDDSYHRTTDDTVEDRTTESKFVSIGQTRGASPVPTSTGTTSSSSQKRPILPSASDCAFMYKYASGYLRSKGYEHYEISSYALLLNNKKPKSNDDPQHQEDMLEETKNSSQTSKRSKHNQIYWEPGSEWYAVGLGATSSIGGHRYARPRALSDYVNWVNLQQNSDHPDWLAASATVLAEDDVIDAHDHDDDVYLTDIIMTRLRTSDGLNLNWIRQNIPNGASKVKAILRGAELGIDLGLAEHSLPQSVGAADTDPNSSRSDSDILRLVDPDGFVFSNTIISSIFLELEEP